MEKKLEEENAALATDCSKGSGLARRGARGVPAPARHGCKEGGRVGSREGASFIPNPSPHISPHPYSMSILSVTPKDGSTLEFIEGCFQSLHLKLFTRLSLGVPSSF